MQDDLVYIDRRTNRHLKFAPIDTPLNRRMQTLGVIWHCCSIPILISPFLICISLGPILWILVLMPYIIWWFIDVRTPQNGKVVYRMRPWMRNLIVWDWFVNYFPIEIHKSCELEPTFNYISQQDQVSQNDEQDLERPKHFFSLLFERTGLRRRLNKTMYNNNRGKSIQVYIEELESKKLVGPRYIFGYHPHGVISMGVMGAFATNILMNQPYEPPFKFLKPLFHDTKDKKPTFPGIGPIFPLTLNAQFSLPFYRDYLLSMGLTSASASNIKRVISNGDNAVCIVVGGAQESLLNNLVSPVAKKNSKHMESIASRGSQKHDFSQIQLILNKRKGFVKIAIELGNINLVPTFAFGEADVYNISKPNPGSWGATFQQWVKSRFSFTIPFFSARGVFIYNFGLLPFRNPINIVVGNPIYIPTDAVNKFYEEKNSKKSSINGDSPSIQKHSRDENIATEVTDHYHRLYVAELKRIYEDNKSKFGYENVSLNILE